MICTGKVAHNSEMLKEILELYVPEPTAIVDNTYGKGSFWKDIPHTFCAVMQGNPYSMVIPKEPTVTKEGNPVHILLASDLYTITQDDGEAGIDCLDMPYKDNSMRVVVNDIPYGGTGGKGSRNPTVTGYGNAVLGSRSWKVILQMHKDAVKEAYRVLVPGGLVIVKSQDQIEAGRQHRITYEIIKYGEGIGFIDEDLFYVVSKSLPMLRHKHQLHGRKNISSFWVGRKRKNGRHGSISTVATKQKHQAVP